jgi:hypothetical protein
VTGKSSLLHSLVRGHPAPRGGARGWSVAVALCLAPCVVACATFSHDLERARDHYDKSEFPEALAVLRVLADDKDALSSREQVEYSYLRGMTDFRLSEAQPPGETRDAFRKYASDYLHVASALDEERPDALTPAQKARLQASLATIEGREPPPTSDDEAAPQDSGVTSRTSQ